MHKRLCPAAGALALLSFGSGAAAAASPPSLLAPVVPRIKAAVRQAQPLASFGYARDILIGQFHTGNFLMHPHAPEGAPKPSPYPEMGPLAGGFYMQLYVARSGGSTALQVKQPTPEQPWTTVTSFYRLPHGRVIVMLWEATPGAPRGVAAKVGRILSTYSARLK